MLGGGVTVGILISDIFSENPPSLGFATGNPGRTITTARFNHTTPTMKTQSKPAGRNPRTVWLGTGGLPSLPRKSILKEEATTELHGVHGVSIRVFIYGFHDVLRAKITRLKPDRKTQGSFFPFPSSLRATPCPPWLKILQVFLKIDFRAPIPIPAPKTSLANHHHQPSIRLAHNLLRLGVEALVHFLNQHFKTGEAFVQAGVETP